MQETCGVLDLAPVPLMPLDLALIPLLRLGQRIFRIIFPLGGSFPVEGISFQKGDARLGTGTLGGMHHPCSARVCTGGGPPTSLVPPSA